LGDTWDLRELPLERRSDGRRHGFRTRALKSRCDLNGGKVDLWQRRDRQERVGGDTHKRERCHHERGCDRATNEWFGEIHEFCPDCADSGELTVTGTPRLSL
jgi:hypothetical protein